MLRLGRLDVTLLGSFGAALLGACLIDNPDFESTSATGTTGDASSSTTAATAATTTASSTSSPATTSGGESASGSGTTDETTGPLTSAASEATTGPDTTSSTGPDATSSTGPDATTEEPPPAKMRLQRYESSQCTVPLWCIYNMDPNQPATARLFSQECFTDLTPPFKITRIGYWIANTKGVPSSPAIALRSYNGAPSPAPIADKPLNPADVTKGYHEIPLDFTVDQGAFCIGLTGGGQYSSSLGVAVDMVHPPLQQSFLRSEGSGGCSTGMAFRDIAIDKPVPTGQWCIDVDIEPL